ncbi:o-succinylbenzoate--CoA ligase [Luteococcus sediminum]
MRLCTPEDLPTLLPDALAGRIVLAPAAPDDQRTLAMLRPELPVAEPDAAVIVATSGSSGVPKGVVLSRRALLASAEASQQRLGPMSWTCVLPTGYVAGLMVLVRAHVAGRTVRLASSDLSDLALAPGANAISIVPTQLFRAMERPEVLATLTRFDVILLGGAAVDDDLLAEGRGRGLNLVTTYGMSETCGGCVWDGEPLPGVEVGLDEGRITLTGEMAFSGYRLQPELTASTLDGRTVLTQDRGEWLDGRLRVLGRLDDVVVSGGVNVDLAAVQRAVDQVEPGSGVVLAVPDLQWGVRIVLVTTSSHGLDWWQRELAGHLGREALPRRLERRDVLPRTSSGKIDRQALLGSLDAQEG